ncbi:MAG: hypothetical protein ACJ789_02640 [Thermomicrobiales bacterium]
MGTTRGYVSREDDWQFDRATKRVGGWLAGFGLLSVNIGLFLIAATGLFLLNLYQDPRNIDVFTRLRPWALLIIFHAVAVTIVWLLSWAIQAGQFESEESPQSTPQRFGPTPKTAIGASPTRARFSPTVSTPVILDSREQSEHFWRRRSTSILRQHEPGVRETWSWSSTDEAEVTHTWPDGDRYDVAPYAPTVEHVQAEREFDDNADVNGHEDTSKEAVAGYPERPQVESEPEPVDTALDPLRFASRQHDSNGTSGDASVLTRWLWIEAAAAAWLAQREDLPASDGESDSELHVPPAEGDSAEAMP